MSRELTKLFLDTEFTDLSKQGELMSIALVENKESFFYAEITDIWPERLRVIAETYPAQSDWIQANVISRFSMLNEIAPFEKTEGRKGEFKGPKEWVKEKLTGFLSNYSQIELVCDVGHFDMIHFIALFGDARRDLPKNVSPVYWDYNQKLALQNNLSLRQAFNKIRGGGHNALHDAFNTYEYWAKLY